jgi:hypothetical protein
MSLVMGAERGERCKLRRRFTFLGREYELFPPWTPAPRGPKLIRYIMCGERRPFAAFTVGLLIFGLLGNLLLTEEGVYGQTTFEIIALVTVPIALLLFILGMTIGMSVWAPNDH